MQMQMRRSDVHVREGGWEGVEETSGAWQMEGDASGSVRARSGGRRLLPVALRDAGGV